MGPFGESPHKLIPEGDNNRFHRVDGTVEEMEMYSIEGECTFNTNPERGLSSKDSLAKIDEIASQMAAQQLDKIFTILNDVTNRTGRVFQVDGGITAKSLNDMLEHMDIQFDQTGAPCLPSLICHPDVSQELAGRKDEIESDLVEKERKETILERKKEEFRAKQSNRRLVS